MNRRAFALALPVALIAAGARASAKKENPDKNPAGPHVELLPVALPVVAYGQVVNYVFVYVRIDLAKGADAAAMRLKEPFFRDALVRVAHRTPFVSAKDFLSLDEAKLKAALTREAAAIAGAGAVKGVVVISQTPKNRNGVPKPGAAGA